MRPGDLGDGVEVPLPRGDVTEGVVRIGATVRRPAQPQSAAVAEYLRHLEAVGSAGAPRYLGRDRAGRDVLDFVEGDVAGDPPESWAGDERLLVSVGRLLRAQHTASAGYAAGRGFVAPPGTSWFTWPPPTGATASDQAEPPPELVSHNDVTPQNVVVRDGVAVGLVDFDLAGPTTRLEDLANTATHWVPLRDPVDGWPGWPAGDQPARLRVLCDAYGLTRDERRALLDLLGGRTGRVLRRLQGAAEHLGGGWARMWDAGSGDLVRRRGTWLAATRADLAAALR